MLYKRKNPHGGNCLQNFSVEQANCEPDYLRNAPPRESSQRPNPALLHELSRLSNPAPPHESFQQPNPVLRALDFSINVNPLGVPERVRHAVAGTISELDRYPDPYCGALVEAISRHENVPRDFILCGAGAAELIYAWCAAVRPKRVLLAVPTFSEYEAALAGAGAEIQRLALAETETQRLALAETKIRRFASPEAEIRRFALTEIQRFALAEADDFRLTERYLDVLRSSDCDAVFLCNPNNPTGRLIDAAMMEDIVDICRVRGIRLFVDECFLDLSDAGAAASVKQHLTDSPGLFVLKAFTKTYGMAGLRLGYGMTSDTELLRAMSAAVQPWNVSLPAQAAGIAALHETEYLDRARTMICSERKWLTAWLQSLGMYVVPSDANFLLFRADERLGERLRARGIYLRECSNFCGLGREWYRTAVRTHAENAALIDGILEVLPDASAAEVRQTSPQPPGTVAINADRSLILPSGMDAINAVRLSIQPLDAAAMEAARERQARLAKPPGSLGRLEELAVQLAGITGRTDNVIQRKHLLVFAADNGVVAEGVSSAPQSVTLRQTVNLSRAKTGASVLARHFGCVVTVCDVGVCGDIREAGVLNRKIARGTGNIARGAAMTRKQAEMALATGYELARGADADVLGVGEMGIGNTTTSAAVLAVLLGVDAEVAAGRGGGLTETAFARKKDVIRRAIAVNAPDKNDILDVLAKVGGFDLAAMCGAFLGAAAARKPVVIDGFISAVAALCACRICQEVRGYLIPSHASMEPGYRLAMEAMKLQPILELSMRLGEGSGCPLASEVLSAACAVQNEMATFEEAGIDDGYLDEIRGRQI